MPAMSCGLDDLPECSLSREAEITHLQTHPDQVTGLNVLKEGFEEPEASRPDLQQYLATSLTESKPAFEHFVARWQGEPCVISTLLNAKHTAGMYHVMVLTAYYGRGLGKALTLDAMQSAREGGYKEALLFATPPDARPRSNSVWGAGLGS